MRYTRTILSIGLLVALAVPSVGWLAHANAQSNSSNSSGGNGIRISPVRTDVSINKGETKTVIMNIQNVTSSEASFKAILNDFIAADGEKGQPALILDDDKYAPSHSLKRYIAAIPNMSLKAGESKDVKVTITIPASAKAGGYYGAVRFAPVSSDSSKNVTLSASVGSIILVKVPGDIAENMTIDSFDVRRGADGVGGSSFFTTNKDLYGVVRFKNSGDVHEQPFGRMLLKKGNKVLQSVEINNTDPKGNVLPDSVRRFNVKLDRVSSFGKYTVQGNFGYGSNGQLLSAETTFWVVPLALIVGIIAAITLIVVAIIAVPRAIKRHNRNVLRKAGRR